MDVMQQRNRAAGESLCGRDTPQSRKRLSPSAFRRYSVIGSENEDDMPYDHPPDPAYQAYESKELPAVSWRRAKRAIATTTNSAPFYTIAELRVRPYSDDSQWRELLVKPRPLMGEHHNEARVRRLRATRPHGLTADGLPWYAGILYAAPSDPIYGYQNLVGVVTWAGHVACLLPGGNAMMRPVVDWLAKRSQHYLVPLVADDPDELYVLLPTRRSLVWQRHEWGIPDPDPGPFVLAQGEEGHSLIGVSQPRAIDLYDAGTPPVHGLAAKPPPSSRVARIKIGDELRVERAGKRWTVSDAEGLIGNLRWTPGLDGRPHSVSGKPVHLPSKGILHVRKLHVDPEGIVTDIGGYVEPA